jgi:RNA polymerase sigma factor (sigma-70 family)
MTGPPDPDRFVTLLEDHKRILYKVATVYCRNREDRGDLIQDIIAQLWRSFGQFDDRNRFSTWMYRVAMNVAISFYRSEGRRIRETVPIDTFGLDLAAADRAMDAAGDDVRILHQLIARLNELNRALIILYLDGYSHDEIAGIMGISATNVATKISRIKQQLQRDHHAANRTQQGVQP